MALFDDKLNKFRSTALEQGFGEDEVNSFLDSPEVKKIMELQRQQSMPQLPEMDAVEGENYVFSDQELDSGFTGFNEPSGISPADMEPGGFTGAAGFTGISQLKPKPSLKKGATGKSVLPKKFAINTKFGARSRADVFSGGINYGTDIGTPVGTQVNAPEGQWVAKSAYGNSPNNGYIGNGTNQGYGNSVLLQNRETGEQMRFSHLSPGVDVKPGQIVNGGQSIGRTGLSGNTSGQHLDLEYYDAGGRLRDVFKSKYRKLFG